MAEWNISQAAKEFCRRLKQSTCVFQEQFCITTLPQSALSPFAEFTGSIPGSTVVVSKALQSECAGSDGTQIYRSYRLVNTSQPLPHKRQFLCQTETFYSGQAGCCDGVVVAVSDGSFPPLSLDKARYILSLFAVGCSQKMVDTSCSVWIYCEDSPTTVLGCSYECRTGSLRSYQLQLQGLLTEEETQSMMAEKIKKPLCSVFSEYGITEEEHSSNGQLNIQFGWADADCLLSPPPESADAVLHISVKPGSHMSPVLSSYHELSTIVFLSRVEQGLADWHGNDDQTLSSHVASFLEELSSPNLRPLSVTVVSPTADLSVYKPRQDLDFAEQLWVFAKDVESTEDLQQLMAGVFKAVLLGKVEPFIHKNSKSNLAVLFRQVLLCSSPDERQTLAPRCQALLSSSNALQCLVQLGIEKLCRDYRCFFVGSDVLNAQYFDEFIREVSTESTSLLSQCHVLCKLHCVLELTASLLAFLNLPVTTLSSFVKSALDVYKEKSFEGFELSPVFCLPLPAYSPALKSVVSLCATLTPTQWSISDTLNTMTVYRRTPFSGVVCDSACYCEYNASCVTLM